MESQLPKAQMVQNSQNTFTFWSVSNDFRFLENRKALQDIGNPLIDLPQSHCEKDVALEKRGVAIGKPCPHNLSSSSLASR
jgi:hypothetical protein